MCIGVHQGFSAAVAEVCKAKPASDDVGMRGFELADPTPLSWRVSPHFCGEGRIPAIPAGGQLGTLRRGCRDPRGCLWVPSFSCEDRWGPRSHFNFNFIYNAEPWCWRSGCCVCMCVRAAAPAPSTTCHTGSWRWGSGQKRAESDDFSVCVLLILI